jgi:hypothetical protein
LPALVVSATLQKQDIRTSKILVNLSRKPKKNEKRTF